jgi:cyclophilin family peptidyl-prolyl cis-trans isomerase
MSSPRRPSRRIPPKARGPRRSPPPDLGESSAGDDATGAFMAPTGPLRPGTRAANRAAKRASSPRPRPAARRRQQRSNTAIIGLVIGAVVIAAAVLAFGNPFGTPSASPSAAAQTTPAPSHGDGTCPTSQPASLAAGDVRTVAIETTKGNIVMKIDGALAPIATGNFVALIACHFYDGIVFHRLMPGFVIQGGDPASDGSGGPGYEIKDDPVNTTYKRGTVAMARGDAVDSQGSQFFIVLADDANQSLSQAPYAILGEVTSGMEVVDTIAAMPNAGGQAGTALEPVTMTRVTVSPRTAPTASPAQPATSPASTALPSPTAANGPSPTIPATSP